jgi:quercetin dioxygenase-like cupin family protein
MNFVKG